MAIEYGREFNEGNLRDAKTQGGTQAFTLEKGKGYVQELAIPWKLLLKEGEPTPKAGERFTLTLEKMLYADTYMTASRVRLSSLGALPAGWAAGKPNLVSAWYDALMSRWLDDEAVATNRKRVKGADGKEQEEPQKVERFRCRVRAKMLLLFGEETLASGKYRVWIDGKAATYVPGGAKEPVDLYDASAARFGGNRHHTQVIATDLDPAVEHAVEIEPVLEEGKTQELRLESICVAGGEARVFPDDKKGAVK
jgi:hypothetical protein